jgi:exodeoxyribonuclease VII large subunit
LPLHVGLVTSVGSAAWHDVTDELARSGFGFRVVACDARVQGEWAADMVAAAIRTLGARPLDVLLVVRGGGARADLATFDSAAVARAIAQSPVPVITGLGHEVDRSVADEVARLALKTPTACAAELVGRVSTFRAAAEGAWAAIEDQTQIRLERAHRGLGNLAGHAARQTRSSVGLAEARLAGHVERLPRDARRRVQGASAQLVRSAERTRADAARSVAVSSGEITSAEARLVRRAPALGGAEATALQAMEARVRALDPAATLARGWSITRTSDGGLVRQATQLAAGDEIVTTLAEGQVRSRVEETRPT